MIVSLCCNEIVEVIDYNTASYYLCSHCSKPCRTKIKQNQGEDKNALALKYWTFEARNDDQTR